MSLYGTEVIEAHWPMDGPHSPELIEAAGVALAELVRYLNRATMPQVSALTEAPHGAGLVGSLATAAHREMQLCRQLATWARQVAADPTVRHDRHRDDAVTTAPGETPARTVLEQRIRERRLTFEEFAEYAETFARQHNEPGTLSVRHLQRLAAGRGEHGRPLSRPRAATARLLERIFGSSIDELLSRPDMASPSRQFAATAATEAAAELTFAVDVAEELAAFFNRAQNRVNWLSHAHPGGDLP